MGSDAILASPVLRSGHPMFVHGMLTEPAGSQLKHDGDCAFFLSKVGNGLQERPSRASHWLQGISGPL